MPDFERPLDDLRRELAETDEEKAWVDGYIVGKSYARKEILIIVVGTVLLVGAAWAVTVTF